MLKRSWIGIVLLIIGVGFLLQQLDFFEFSEILSTWWPLILIIIGLIQLTNRPNSSSVPGMFLILLGAIFLGNQFADVNLFTYLWPLFLIVIGFIFIFSKKSHRRITDSKDAIRSLSLFSGSHIRSNSENFKGGEVTTIFGGAEIDLRKIAISGGEAHLELNSIFGGITLFVPEDIRVEIKGTPIFGGWENKTRGPVYQENSSVLYINCIPIFGGIEIKD